MPQIFRAKPREISRSAPRAGSREDVQHQIHQDLRRVLEQAGVQVHDHNPRDDHLNLVTLKAQVFGRQEILKVDHKGDGEVSGIRLDRDDVELALWLKEQIYHHGQGTYHFPPSAGKQPRTLRAVPSETDSGNPTPRSPSSFQDTQGRRSEQQVDAALAAKGLGPVCHWFNRTGESGVSVDFLVNGYLLEVKSSLGLREAQPLTAGEWELATEHPDRYLLALVTFSSARTDMDFYGWEEGLFHVLEEQQFWALLETGKPGMDVLLQKLHASRGLLADRVEPVEESVSLAKIQVEPLEQHQAKVLGWRFSIKASKWHSQKQSKQH